MSICKFCGQEKKLVKAHIIPRAFFEAIKLSESKHSRGEKLKGVTNSRGNYPFRDTTKGFYDSNLVCLDCEGLFGPTDDYAVQILLKNPKSHVPHYLNGELLAWIINEYDYKKLMLFFISLLWRAGASSLKEFEKVSLGPYLDTAKIALNKQNLADIEKFSVFIARFENGIGRNIILDPHLESKNDFNGIKVYRFYLGAGYIVHIKVDKRAFPIDFENLKLFNGRALAILNRGQFEASKELIMVQKVYEDAEKLSQSWNK
jgi:hypothetical protein